MRTEQGAPEITFPCSIDTRPPDALRLSPRHVDRQVDGVDHALPTRHAFAGDVKGDAVIDRRPDDGRPSVTLTPSTADHVPLRGSTESPRKLHRNVSLVVIHRDDGVVLPGSRFDEDGVSGTGPSTVIPS